MQYLAAAAFKLFCADLRLKWIQFPKLFRSMYHDSQQTDETTARLLGAK